MATKRRLKGSKGSKGSKKNKGVQGIWIVFKSSYNTMVVILHVI